MKRAIALFVLLAAGALLLTPVAAQDKPLPDGLYATLRTSKGNIKIRLYEKDAPETVRNFVELARGQRPWQEMPGGKMVLGEPFFDGLIFHRVIDNFMIQIGAYASYGTRHSANIPDENDNGHTFDRAGLVAMANAGPGTGSSQFFITHRPTPHLNGKHAIFGEVVEGQSVVNRIGKAPRDNKDRPYSDITLFGIDFERVGPAPSPMDEPGIYGEFETSLGEFTVRFFEKEAPQTVAHIVALAEGKKRWKLITRDNEEADVASEDNWITGRPYFDGLIFHRVIKTFMSQTGGFQPDGVQHFSDIVPDEFDNGLKYDRPGRVGMAHAGPGTARAGIFITHLPVDRLDGRYTVFGQVVDGIDVVWKMANGTLLQNERGEQAVPDPPIVLQRVTIHRTE